MGLYSIISPSSSLVKLIASILKDSEDEENRSEEGQETENKREK